MLVISQEVLPIGSDEDIVRVRQAVRNQAAGLGFSLVDQTKIVTAASELARNALIYGGGGSAEVAVVEANARRGLRLTFSDQGPGIPNIELAMRDGYSTGSGLGFGLGGAKRLVNDFAIQSQPGSGTRVTVVRWR